jgi:hypothetical protein
MDDDKLMSIPETDPVKPEAGDATQIRESLPAPPVDVRIKEMPKNPDSNLSRAAFVVSLLSLAMASLGVLYQLHIAALGAMPAISLYSRWEMNTLENTSEPQISTLMWKIENTGLGPAVVSVSELYIPATRKHYRMDDQGAWLALKAVLSKHFNLQDLPIVGFNYDPVTPGYAVRPGGEWPLFEISLRGVPVESLYPALDLAVVAVCYCSLHGTCFYQDSRDSLHRQQPLFACPEKQDIQTLMQSGRALN